MTGRLSDGPAGVCPYCEKPTRQIKVDFAGGTIRQCFMCGGIIRVDDK